MLLLGVVQAQASGAGPLVASDFDLLQTEILTGSTASVTFSSLGDYASTYQHLQIRAVLRSTHGDTDSLAYLQINGDTGANYSSHMIRGTGSTVTPNDTGSGRPNGLLIYNGLPAASGVAGNFGANVIDILDPFNSTKYTTIRTLAGQAGSFSRIALESASWRNTASVTSLTFDDIFGNFAQYSRFSLYGLKKASV